MHFLADCSLLRGDCPEAETRYCESLRAALDLGDVIETSIEVQGVAMAKAGQGQSARALELASSVEALWRSLGRDLHIAFGTDCWPATSGTPRLHWDRLRVRSRSWARASVRRRCCAGARQPLAQETSRTSGDAGTYRLVAD